MDRAISALPFVEDENFSLASDGEAIFFLPWYVLKRYKSERNVLVRDQYSVSEYTMSEIITSVYELMEDSGAEEGILFLDEINCVEL